MKSLRWRLLATLGIAIFVLWSSMAAWMFTSIRRELISVLDDRLIASTRMVAGIVQQFSHEQIQSASVPGKHVDLTSVIARDGVACEVSLVRAEVELLPLARTENSPGFDSLQGTGFGRIDKGGKLWRTFVLEENGIRIATADRIDVREGLVHSFAYAMVLPFAMALLGLLGITWWACTKGLEPLRRLQHTLAKRPPQDGTPIEDGRDIEELAPMVNSLNALLLRMNAVIEHERRWTADAAHELRTPLTAIKTHVQVTQLLVQRELKLMPGESCLAAEQMQQSLEYTMSGITHMHDTLEQLLMLARVESGSALNTHKLSGIAIVGAFERACEQSQQHAAEQGHTAQLQTHVSPGAPEDWQSWQVALPAPLLVCAVSNLVDNALRHHQGQEPVTAHLELEEQAGQICISIRDHGPGMSQAECEQALRRFWRKNPSSQGSGLGLTIVQRIVDSVQGQLSVQGAPGGGLMVRLHLPAVLCTSAQCAA